MALEEIIKAQAIRLGFDLVGITTPDPPAHIHTFTKWLDAGMHGEMDYLASDRSRRRRSDPSLILPECRSILVLGLRYPAPVPMESDPTPRILGKVAAYAWNRDYHDVIPDRLKTLIAFVETEIGQEVPHRLYTDTGPILERDYAQAAGLGWIGKNTCLINPEIGSHFFLAEILLGIDLTPDPPFSFDRCGSCTRCIEACPTQCILADRIIDARACISYLTIELKNQIPPQLRPSLGDWVFGCDVCQQVCPWNERFATSESDPAFMPKRPALETRAGESQHPDLIEGLSLSPQEFNRRFKGSPIKRAKRRGYLRNVAVALGNRRDPQAIPALERALKHDPEALVRGHAAWALGHIGTDLARKALRDSLDGETDQWVREEIARALKEFAYADNSSSE